VPTADSGRTYLSFICPCCGQSFKRLKGQENKQGGLNFLNKAHYKRYSRDNRKKPSSRNFDAPMSEKPETFSNWE